MGKEIVTSIRVDEDLWKEAKVYAVKNDISLGELVERLIRKELGKPPRKSK